MAGTPDVLSGTFAGRYTIERELGRGATATVYLARDTQRGHSVAVKLLKHELAASVGADRFLREIKLNEQLHHPHIVPVLDSGEQDGRLYFVLPHMEDGSLRQMLEREHQLPVEAAIAITLTIAEALDYAHQQKLIHRDVKPENILFTSGQACLADFGIARAVERALDQSTTETGMVRGTPAYMSPEQASGSKQYDGRSDQYSLACVLYEMLAGVPAFIGPTPEAVIAQRFQHPPRELRVYRPSVPAAVESVITKALSIAPADRYNTSADFAAALRAAPRAAAIERRASGPSVRMSRSRVVAFSGAGIFVAAVIALASGPTIRALVTDGWSDTDTTRYLVFPVEGTDSSRASQATELAKRALGEWKGLTTVSGFDVAQALPARDEQLSAGSARRVARRMNAGRFSRIRLTSDGSEARVHGALFDVASDSQLSQASVGFRLDFSDAAPAFERLIRLLLMRADSLDYGSTSLPAVQLFAAGHAAMLEFDLPRADSLMQAAVDRDPDFVRASLWLSQLRVWRRSSPVTSWKPLAEKALLSDRLEPRERQLARALMAMANRQFDVACALYDDLRRRSPTDYVAWLGIGECHRRDNVVIPDRRSPSGWRFRQSPQRAARAYARAFEIAATAGRGFAPGAYSQLRADLFADRARVAPGFALPPDTGLFHAYATWQGDSLTFIPYRSALIQSGRVSVDPELRLQALNEQRKEYRRIANVWATTMPTSAGAKEAVAIALEMAGEPSAVDTLRLARQLSKEPLHQLRLAAEEFLVRVAVHRHDTEGLRRAVRLADSLLSAPVASADRAMILAPVATLLGRCRTASALVAQSTTPQLPGGLPFAHYVVAAADSLTVRVALGCDRTLSIRRLIDIAAAERADQPAARTQTEYALFSQAIPLLVPLDSERTAQLARATGDYLLRVQAASMEGRSDTVRAILGQQQKVRGTVGAAEVSFDAALAEARAWLAIGDSAIARAWLDPVLERRSWLEKLWDTPVSAASLVQMAGLRAELANANKESSLARDWARMVATLWAGADSELQPLTRRMEQIARK